jgi:hypothetical protein
MQGDLWSRFRWFLGSDTVLLNDCSTKKQWQKLESELKNDKNKINFVTYLIAEIKIYCVLKERKEFILTNIFLRARLTEYYCLTEFCN